MDWYSYHNSKGRRLTCWICKKIQCFLKCDAAPQATLNEKPALLRYCWITCKCEVLRYLIPDWSTVCEAETAGSRTEETKGAGLSARIASLETTLFVPKEEPQDLWTGFWMLWPCLTLFSSKWTEGICTSLGGLMSAEKHTPSQPWNMELETCKLASNFSQSQRGLLLVSHRPCISCWILKVDVAILLECFDCGSLADLPLCSGCPKCTWLWSLL